MDNRKWIVTAISVCIVGSLLLSGAMAVSAQSFTEYAYKDEFNDGVNNWSAGTESGGTLEVPGATVAYSQDYSSGGPGNGNFTLDARFKPTSGNSAVGVWKNDTNNVEVIMNAGVDRIALRVESNAAFASVDVDKQVNKTYYTPRVSYDGSGTYTLEVDGETLTLQDPGNAAWAGGQIEIAGESTTDYIRFSQAGQTPGYLSGTVTDATNGEGVEGATVTVSNATYNTSTKTGQSGQYELEIKSGGQYNVTTREGDYLIDRRTVNITEGEQTELNIQLVPVGDSFRFDAPGYMEHGSERAYSATAQINGTWKSVTNDTSVLSTDIDAIQVDSVNNVLVSTSDRSVAKTVNITVSYTYPDGEDIELTHQVVVANETVNNIGILPPTQKFTAVIGGGTDQNPADKSYLAIFLATALASAVSLIATVTAGLAILPVVLFAAMIVGFVEIQVVIAATLVCIFLGLNIGQNIDYGVR
jgi:hypothetical protein